LDDGFSTIDGEMRGVLYMVWGHGMDAMLERSLASLRQIHPDLPVHIERSEEPAEKWRGLLKKAAMARISPFEQTLFLDADTTVLGNLDYGFEMAARHGLACAHCESPWARRHQGLKETGDLVEFNTGVLFFGAKARPVLDAWERLVSTVDSSTVFVTPEGNLERQNFDDQASFAAAVKETEFVPFVLPLNWNFRPMFHRTFFGPLKIWHDYAAVPAELQRICQYYTWPNSIIQFHEIGKKPQ
jgi:hypothetical protein